VACELQALAGRRHRRTTRRDYLRRTRVLVVGCCGFGCFSISTYCLWVIPLTTHSHARGRHRAFRAPPSCVTATTAAPPATATPPQLHRRYRRSTVDRGSKITPDPAHLHLQLPTVDTRTTHTPGVGTALYVCCVSSALVGFAWQLFARAAKSLLGAWYLLFVRAA
jgi:hypothetical protein